MTFDRLTTPNYTVPEAAYILSIKTNTLRNWVRGRHYQVGQEKRFSRPLIKLDDPAAGLMSFTNLVEAHVLSAMRGMREDEEINIAMPVIRDALDYLERQMNSERPLVDHQFLTDGKELFIEKLGHLINIKRHGQKAIKDVLSIYLRRIEVNSAGRPIRIYPVGADPQARHVMVDPRLSAGRLISTKTGIPIDVLIGRYDAGESLESIADDYEQEKETLEKAIFWKTAA